MVRFKHRYLVATIAASPEKAAELGPKEISAMLKASVESQLVARGRLFLVYIILLGEYATVEAVFAQYEITPPEVLWAVRATLALAQLFGVYFGGRE